MSEGAGGELPAAVQQGRGRAEKRSPGQQDAEQPLGPPHSTRCLRPAPSAKSTLQEQQVRALLWARPRAESLPRGPVVSKGICSGGTFPGLPPGASVSQSDVNTLNLLLAPRGTKAHVSRQSLSSTASSSASKTHAVTPLPSQPLSASQWEMCELGWETRIRPLHALLAAGSRSSPARGAVLGTEPSRPPPAG